jgi:hypothetical protein
MGFSRMAAAVAVAAAGMSVPAFAQQANMTFFVTSAGSGKGGDLGGLDGADAHCAALAKAAGAKATNWHAYLSTALPGGDQGVDARSRIGKGPWQNAKGVVVAKSVDDLHSGSNNLNKQTALTEKGDMVNGRGDKPNEHDMLTGSDAEGHFSTAGGGHHLRQLDQERRRLGDRRPPRPAGAEGHAAHEVLELVARQRGLQPGGPGEDRRRRQVLLLRRELSDLRGRKTPLRRGFSFCKIRL